MSSSKIYDIGIIFGGSASYISSLYYMSKGEFKESFGILGFGSFITLTWPVTIPFLIAGYMGIKNNEKLENKNKDMY
jgi:succinate-acetate transporter protein